MKSLKLKKVHYWDLEKLMDDCEVVDGDKANPSLVFVNELTLRVMRKTITEKYKKQDPHLSKKYIDYSVSMYMLNLAPDTSNAIKDGYCIVEEERIEYA